MDQEFNHAANDSPRSGSSKQVTPVVWGAIVLAIVALAIWFAMDGGRLRSKFRNTTEPFCQMP